MSENYDGPDAIVDENLDEVDQDCEGAHLNEWNELQELFETRDQEGNIATRVWDPDFAAADALVPFFFGRGGRMLHELGRNGVTLSHQEYQRVAQELQPEVDDAATGIVAFALGYPVVGIVNITNITPDHPHVWIFFVPAIEPIGALTVIPRAQASLWQNLLEFPRHINAENIRGYMANDVARELRRRFGLVTGIHVGIPVSADPDIHHHCDGVDVEDADDILVPNVYEGDDRYFAGNWGVELDGPEEVADESEEEIEEDESEEDESEEDDGEDDDEDDD